MKNALLHVRQRIFYPSIWRFLYILRLQNIQNSITISLVRRDILFPVIYFLLLPPNASHTTVPGAFLINATPTATCIITSKLAIRLAT